LLAGGVAFGGGVLIGLLAPTGGATRLVANVVPPVPLRVEGELPEWRAPGGALTVSGWTGPGRPVSLVLGGRRIATATSGALGRFVVTGRAPVVGRATRFHRVELVSGAERRRLGRVLVRPVRLAAVGDVSPGQGVSETVASRGISYPWSSVAPVLRRADVATANLEGVISSRGSHQPGRQYHFRGDRGLLRGAARTAGIDVVSVANNHALDFGREALLDTLAASRATGIRTVGGGATIDVARRPVVVDAGGLRIALLGYSDVRPLGSDAGPDWAGTVPADSIGISDDVRAAVRRADLVVVWFHWGAELATEPSSRQRELAAAALAAGATVVLGAHPHVLQPVEREGRRLVAWSLGNFVFPSGSPGTTRTGILVVSLGAHGVRGARLVPATIHGFRPQLDRAS
jgi:poly-gamma-glutamate synthesis protein (capsule biosynthesis protein)